MKRFATSPLTRRNLLLGGILTGASALAFARRPDAPPGAPPMTLDDAVPRQVGAFRETTPAGFVLPPAGPLTERTYVAVLTRLYEAEGTPPVMLLVAQGRAGDPGMSVHRPERCYGASGFAVAPRPNLDLAAPFPSGAQAVRMTASRDDRVEQVLFWTRVGGQFPGSALDQRLVTIRQNLAGVLPPGLLFRLSMVDRDADAAFSVLDRFNATLVAALGAPARMTLLGR